MQASNAPTKSAVPFANSGTKNTIPVASQISVTPGAASFTDGFPPLTMTPLAAGGVPPYGADFNGILNFLSAAIRWSQAGGSYVYDAAFAASVGGYPKGALLVRADLNGYWLNTVENNSTNPDSGGAGWKNPNAGGLLRTSVYRINGGTQQVSIDGGAFTATGATTFTSLAGTQMQEVLVLGGGGGGGGTESNGGTAASSGSGGGGGGEASSLISGTQTSIAITVGAGGTAGTGSGGGGAGGTGGTSSFGSAITATGGAGGARGLTTTSFPILGYGGQGGLGSLGNVANSKGESGGVGFNLALLHRVSGGGGGSSLGGGAPSAAVTAGIDAISPGAGGGGAAAGPSTGPFNGGAGASGLVLIKEYS